MKKLPISIAVISCSAGIPGTARAAQEAAPVQQKAPGMVELVDTPCTPQATDNGNRLLLRTGDAVQLDILRGRLEKAGYRVSTLGLDEMGSVVDLDGGAIRAWSLEKDGRSYQIYFGRPGSGAPFRVTALWAAGDAATSRAEEWVDSLELDLCGGE